MTRAEENREYMERILQFLDQLLYAAFLMKRKNDSENLSMRGLVITEKEIDQAFGQLYREETLPSEVLKSLQMQTLEIHQQEETAEELLPFFTLCKDFALSNLERLALLLAAAPCYDRKYERIYGYLQDRVDMPSPTRGLCVTLAAFLTPLDEEEQASFLAGEGGLELLISSVTVDSTGLSSAYTLRGRVRDYLYGTGEPEECLKGRVTYYDGKEKPEPMVIREEYLTRLENLFSKMQEEEPEDSCMILISGPEGIGRRFLMKHLAADMGLRLLFLKLSGMERMNVEKRREICDALIVESVLSRACVCLVEHGERRAAEEEEEQPPQEKEYRKQVLSFLGDELPCIFLLVEEKGEWFTDFEGRKVSLELPFLSPGERIRLWKAYSPYYEMETDVDLEQLGNKYLLTCRGIRDVLDTAELLAGMDGKTAIGSEEIRQAVRQNQKNQLGAFSQLLNSPFIWEDLILGEESKRQMRMVCDQVKYRDVVGEQWGFHKKTPYGRGLSVLFYGPPGTGKTMAAQVIANELGLDLYRIDISQMVSKYIGETQKNISQLFQKAKDINAVLFFDEADSLFAKRSEAKDSHDRNANAETAHLLQKLEDYEGITVLATNYLNNIDDAFKRRIKFIIHIAFPEADVRLKLWQSMLPIQARCDEELDFEFFAEHFELSGSSIKEILVHAAYLAASEHRGLKNCDMVEAVKLNYAKYGKILSSHDFGYLG